MLIGTDCVCIKTFKVKIKGKEQIVKKGSIFKIKDWFNIEDNIYIEFDGIDTSFDIDVYYEFFEWKATIKEILSWKK